MNARMILALPLFWLACTLAGYLYCQEKNIPWAVAQLAAPAFLLEATFYLILGVEQWRTRLEKLSPPAVAAIVTGSAAIPYCAAALMFRQFQWWSLVWILLLAGTVSFWYVILPKKISLDLLLLALMALVVLTKVISPLYPRPPEPKLHLEALGQAMWIRTGLFALLSVRRVRGVGFGFWPSAKQWQIGALHFAMFLPVAAAIAWGIHFAKPHAPSSSWPQTSVLVVLTFFGTLWVLALGEEFFFRGLLQQWLTEWLKNEWAGLVAASLLFGSVHFFYGDFPNWRFAILGSVAGLFYGLSFRTAKSIRASMVTHALTVTTWKIFFS